MNIGVGASDITPPLGAPLAGYNFERLAEGVNDPLRARAMVVDDGREPPAALVACDIIEMHGDVVGRARRAIEAACGIPADRVLISATHCHTGPTLTPECRERLARGIVESVAAAAARKRPARLLVAAEPEPSLPHNRRYRMRDGTVRTNPGFLNPDVVGPVGPIDSRVGILYAEDERGEPIATWVNYALHLDTVGGTWISADYPRYLADALGREKGPDMATLLTIGAAGDINHWDVARPGPQRGHEEARRIGETLADAVGRAYGRLEAIAAPRVRAGRSVLRLPAQTHGADEVEEARRILATPPPADVDFTLERVKAERVMAIEARAGEAFSAELQVLAIGPAAFVGIPGECFVELGLAIQRRSPFPHTFVVTFANDHLDYIVTRQAFEEGGYEPTSSRLASGAGEALRDALIDLLDRLAGLQDQ